MPRGAHSIRFCPKHTLQRAWPVAGQEGTGHPASLLAGVLQPWQVGQEAISCMCIHPCLGLVTPRQGVALGFVSSLLCQLKPLGAWLMIPAPGSAQDRISLPGHPTLLLPFG